MPKKPTEISNWVTVSKFPMKTYVGIPTGSGPFPAIVVLHKGNVEGEIANPALHNEPGVDKVTRDYCDKLVSEGYAVAAPDLFHRMDESTWADGSTRAANMMDEDIEDDINATVKYLRNQPRIDGEKLGILGFALGGRAAWLGAAANPHFKAAVIYYGGAIMLPKSSIALRGNVIKAQGSAARTPFERTSGIKCPILFHFGEAELPGHSGPDQADMAKLDAELTRLGKPHQFFSYANAGHHFAEYDEDRYRPAAAKLALERTLSFLKEQLLKR